MIQWEYDNTEMSLEPLQIVEQIDARWRTVGDW